MNGSTAPLGPPSPWMSMVQIGQWGTIVAEFPGLPEASRIAVETASVLRAKMAEGGDMKPSELSLLNRLRVELAGMARAGEGDGEDDGL